jgi:hypothetical protein
MKYETATRVMAYLEKHLQLGLVAVPQALLCHIDDIPVLVPSFGGDLINGRLPLCRFAVRDGPVKKCCLRTPSSRFSEAIDQCSTPS